MPLEVPATSGPFLGHSTIAIERASLEEKIEYVKAYELKVGDVVVTDEGRQLTVIDIQIKTRETIRQEAYEGPRWTKGTYFFLTLREGANRVNYTTEDDGIDAKYAIIRGRTPSKAQASQIELVEWAKLPSKEKHPILMDKELSNWARAKGVRPVVDWDGNVTNKKVWLWKAHGVLIRDSADKSALPSALFLSVEDAFDGYDGKRPFDNGNVFVIAKKKWAEFAKVFATESAAWMALELAWHKLPEEFRQACWNWNPQ